MWIINELKTKNSIYFRMLAMDTCSSKLFSENCKFLGIIWKNAIYSSSLQVQSQLNDIIDDQQQQKQKSSKYCRNNLCTLLLEKIIKQLEEKYAKRDFGK